MDPFTAISLAGNIITFIDIATKLCVSSRELHNSVTGSTAEHLLLEEASGRLTKLSKNLRTGQGLSKHTSPHTVALQESAASCISISDKLKAALDSLKTKKHSRWESFGKALLTIWKRDELERLEAELSSLKSEMLLHLVALARDEQFTLNRDSMAAMEDRHQITRGEISKGTQQVLQAIENLKKDEHNQAQSNVLATRLLQMHIEEEERILINRFLDDLYLPYMHERRSQIHNAFGDTFDWMLQDHDLDDSNGFAEWLRNGTGLYWITGKPGSGKSTLMKHIERSGTTRENLRIWAGDKQFILSSFYFWISGGPMQKTMVGLLQSLIYTILKASPTLIPLLFPWRWRQYKAHGRCKESYTETEYTEAIETLQSLALRDFRFFFLIDGLDEFAGEHEWLLHFLKKLCGQSHIKLCVASREWPIFQDAFSDTPVLRMQDYTRRDITSFAQGTLGSSNLWIELSKGQPQDSEGIIKKIVDKAEGVFLWVYLVIRSLKEGIKDGDTFEDLESRVDALPGDLEAYFMQILRQIKPEHLSQARRYLRFALGAPTPQKLWTYAYVGSSSQDCVGQAYSGGVLTAEQIVAECAAARRRIKGRCKEFLEVVESNDRGPLVAIWHQIIDTKVVFLHRTVKDFLGTSGANALLQVKDDSDYDVLQETRELGLLQLKKWPDLYRARWSLVLSTIEDLRMSDSVSNCEPSVEYLNELVLTFNRHQKPLEQCLIEPMERNNSFIEIFTDLQYDNYLEFCLQTFNSIHDFERLEMLLRAAIDPYGEFESDRKRGPHPRIVKMLVDAMITVAGSRSDVTKPIDGPLEHFAKRFQLGVYDIHKDTSRQHDSLILTGVSRRPQIRQLLESGYRRNVISGTTSIARWVEAAILLEQATGKCLCTGQMLEMI